MKAEPHPSMSPDNAPFIRVCVKSIQSVGISSINFEPIAVGAGKRTGLIFKPKTISSHIIKKIIPKKVGTKNLIKLELYFFESIEFNHHPIIQIPKNNQRYKFMLVLPFF